MTGAVRKPRWMGVEASVGGWRRGEVSHQNLKDTRDAATGTPLTVPQARLREEPQRETWDAL